MKYLLGIQRTVYIRNSYHLCRMGSFGEHVVLIKNSMSHAKKFIVFTALTEYILHHFNPSNCRVARRCFHAVTIETLDTAEWRVLQSFFVVIAVVEASVLSFCVRWQESAKGELQGRCGSIGSGGIVFNVT